MQAIGMERKFRLKTWPIYNLFDFLFFLLLFKNVLLFMHWFFGKKEKILEWCRCFKCTNNAHHHAIFHNFCLFTWKFYEKVKWKVAFHSVKPQKKIQFPKSEQCWFPSMALFMLYGLCTHCSYQFIHTNRINTFVKSTYGNFTMHFENVHFIKMYTEIS